MVGNVAADIFIAKDMAKNGVAVFYSIGVTKVRQVVEVIMVRTSL